MSYIGKINPKFPPVPDDQRIHTRAFLEAAKQVLPLMDAISSAFKPVKSDVSGNIEKLTKKYEMDPERFVTINDMLEDEITNKTTTLASIGGLWLKRGIEFLEAFLSEIVEDHRKGTKSSSLVPLSNIAYEKTLKCYHNWIAQKAFGLLSRILPNRETFFKNFNEGREGCEDQTVDDLVEYLVNMEANCKVLNKLFKDLNLDSDEKV